MQADCYIYDDVNRQFGVDEADHARWERRLKRLRPGLARIFLPTSEFNPSGDGKTYDWNTIELQRQYRNLAVLRDAGARVNLCLGPWTNKRMTEPGSEQLAVDLVEHLLNDCGFDHIGWLSLFNEPDAIYAPDTPLNADLKARGFGGGLPFGDYLEKHHAALALLQARGLGKQVRLVVGDMAWPPARRLEWLRLLAPEFGPDASYSFHHYAPDEESFDHFFAVPESRPFRPPPLADEVRGYRAAVGPDAELICWEFNQAGWSIGGSAAFMGVGAHGEDHVGSFATAVAHARKVLTMLGHGVDALSHWCVGDMFYRSGLKQGVMYCGLWRYRWESWVPRPVYFYYAALIDAFRPGNPVHALAGLPAKTAGLAARGTDGSMTIALLNHGSETVHVSLAVAASLRRLRISPDRLPRRPDVLDRETVTGETPLADWQAVEADTATHPVQIDPQELTLLRDRA
ncbi:MAG: hypothetical protein BWZ02_01580 [Lentisphaerae bacterium ADurb.BinA184]|nr:MAG: hypothetical protein BWZ02_01580 [Lentisphaerae bacterium ADurb.BinA184]